MISVNTERTEGCSRPPESESLPPRFRGWILFDADCHFCLAWVRRLSPILVPRGFVFLPLQTPWVRAFLQLPEEKLLGEMRLLTRNRQSFGGADAIVELAKRVWWAWPFVAFAHLPGTRALLRTGYRAIAARRHCVNSSCSLRSLGGLE